MAAKSILESTKKALGLAKEYDAFDAEIIMHINSVFSTLAGLGVGPTQGFMIEDATPTWEDFIPGQDPRYNSVQSYMYLKVRLLFDPPATSFAIAAFEKQAEEFEVRLNITSEDENWVDPDPPTDPILAEIVDGVWA